MVATRRKLGSWRRGRGGIGRLILALVALRALVPAGFMFGAVDGRLSVVLCEPGVIAMAPGMTMPDGTTMAANAMMPDGAQAPPSAHDHRHGTAPATEHGSDCPYAQSAGPALQPAIPWLGGHPPPAIDRAPRVLAQIVTPSRPARQFPPRGPPSSLESLI